MNLKIYPKVLVISHNVFSLTSNNGKTMDAFFNGWDDNCISQLYFHSEIPTSNTCKRYFRITDFDLLKSIIKFKSPGEVIFIDENTLNSKSSRIDTGIEAEIYKSGRKIKSLMYFLRNLIWRLNTWNSRKLNDWIDEFNPEVIFLVAGDYTFSIELALKICKKRNIPLVVFFGDDYYFLEERKKSILNKWNYYSFKKSFNELFSYLKAYICASDKMLDLYTDKFFKEGYAIMTPTIVNNESESCMNNNIKISYMGNLGYERWKPLIEIGKCLKEINLQIDIYSHEKRGDVLSELSTENGIKFHGAVSSREVKSIIESSTIIVHVESIKEEIKNKTRYSMSTKIAESLGSGVCLFAYGPEDVSSIEYLIENNAACVVTRKEDLKSKLYAILENKELRKKHINNAYKLASSRHDFNKNTHIFYKIIAESLNKKEGNWNENSSN